MVSSLELFFGVAAIATLSLGCSPPEGGFVEPTEAEMVHYSDHVVVGTVLRRIYPDPYYKNAYKNMTYGAKVQVRCTYKGGALGDTITIHGAGIIPGHCTEKSLDKDQEYILLLDGPEGQEQTYSQTYPAEIYTQAAISKFLQVCGVDMKYPTEGGMTLPRKSCPQAVKTANCQRYSEGKPKPKTVDGSREGSVKIQLKGNETTTVNPKGGSPATSTSWVLLALGPLIWGLLHV